MQLPMFVKSSVYNATLKLGNTNENHGLPILGLQINKTKNMIWNSPFYVFKIVIYHQLLLLKL